MNLEIAIEFQQNHNLIVEKYLKCLWQVLRVYVRVDEVWNILFIVNILGDWQLLNLT